MRIAMIGAVLGLGLGCGGESYDGEMGAAGGGAASGEMGADATPGDDGQAQPPTGEGGDGSASPASQPPASGEGSPASDASDGMGAGETPGDAGDGGDGAAPPPDPGAPDCAPDDPWAGPGAEEICGDWVDDDCDGDDGVCPTTAAAVSPPAWDCQGMPPSEVLAWAPVVGDGSACGVIFGAAGAFYFAPINFAFSCPGAFQERRHAWTTTEGECESLLLVAHFDFDRPADFSQYGEEFDYDEQPTSNACRKVLMYLAGGLEFAYVGSTEQVVRDRLALYPALEVGCHEWTGTQDFAPVELSKMPFVFNEGFVAPE